MDLKVDPRFLLIGCYEAAVRADEELRPAFLVWTRLPVFD